MAEVRIVRLYLTEGEKNLNSLLKYLHNEAKVKGATVFRGITGFGKSGSFHSAGLSDLSFDLPLVVEFFDAPHNIEQIIEDLRKIIEPGHMISWSAEDDE